MFEPVSASFYLQDTVALARSLPGLILVRRTTEGLTAGMIVETEAYLSRDDPACHASRGMTRRNAPMFGPPGRAYVYFIYGSHFCFNVTAAAEGTGEAVLVRALEPLDGLDLISRRRGSLCNSPGLTNGPGKLCQALHIDSSLNHHDLRNPPLWIAAPDSIKKYDLVCAPRIGLSRAPELMLRFYIRENRYVSRRVKIETGNPGTGN